MLITFICPKGHKSSLNDSEIIIDLEKRTISLFCEECKKRYVWEFVESSPYPYKKIGKVWGEEMYKLEH